MPPPSSGTGPSPSAEKPSKEEKRGGKAPSLGLVLGIVGGILVLALGIFFGTRLLMGGPEPEPSATTPTLPRPTRPRIPPPAPTEPVAPAEPTPDSMSVDELMARAKEATAHQDYQEAIRLYQAALSRGGSVNSEAEDGLRSARAALAKQQAENERNERFLKDYQYSLKAFQEGDYPENLRVAWRLIYPDDTLARQLGKRDEVADLIRNGYYNWAVQDLKKDNVRGAQQHLSDLMDFDRKDPEARKLQDFTNRYLTRNLDDNYRDVVRNLTPRGIAETP